MGQMYTTTKKNTHTYTQTVCNLMTDSYCNEKRKLFLFFNYFEWKHFIIYNELMHFTIPWISVMIWNTKNKLKFAFTWKNKIKLWRIGNTQALLCSPLSNIRHRNDTYICICASDGIVWNYCLYKWIQAF